MLNPGMLMQTFDMSIRNIRNNRMRSFLTMLGIIIGVASVISLVSIVDLTMSQMLSQFSSMGAGSITVTVMGTPLKKGLSEQDLEEIAAVEAVDSISPTVPVNTLIVKDQTIYDKISVQGANEQFFIHNGAAAQEGRILNLSDMEGSVNVCLLDEDSKKVLFPDTRAADRFLQIGGIQYRIAGVMKKKESIFDDMGGYGSEGTIYIPYRNAMRMNNTNAVTSLDVYITDTSRTDEAEAEIEAILRNTFNQADNAFSIMNMESLLSALNESAAASSMMLGGIASIALLVGGIGIMNMMLVSVTERTREIGLRKALGADPVIIQIQFLLESVILSLCGGLIGIVIGEVISYVASLALKTGFTLNFGAIALGFFFSLAVGILFGWAPARKASLLNPIEALRAE